MQNIAYQEHNFDFVEYIRKRHQKHPATAFVH